MNKKGLSTLSIMLIVLVLVIAGVGAGAWYFESHQVANFSGGNGQASGDGAGGISTSTVTTSTTSTQASTFAPCTNANPNVAFSSGTHGLQVLFPPTAGQPYYNDVMTYLANNPQVPVCGALFSIPWATVDKGLSANPQYDFSTIDNEIAPWIKAGKLVDLVVSATTYGNGAASLANVPQYVRSQVDVLSCRNDVPVYWEPAYVTAYQALMKAVVAHYGSNASVGYIRFGLGMGGETGLVFGFNTASCQTQLTKYGYTQSVWQNYLSGMLAYEKSLNSPKQLMVAINVLQYGNDDSIPDSTAAAAVANGIGFGSEGLSTKDISNYAAGKACISDWCNLFNTYQGKVPLELQTVFASNPNLSGQTGSLVSILPFAVAHHAQDLELYWQDWLTAFDPKYPANAQYGTSYAQAFKNAAAVVGK